MTQFCRHTILQIMVIYKFVQQKSAFKLLCIFLIFFKAGDFCKKNGVNTFLLWWGVDMCVQSLKDVSMGKELHVNTFFRVGIAFEIL